MGLLNCNWPDQLLGIINNAMALAVEDRESVPFKEDGEEMMKYFENANLEVAWSERPGIFHLDIYALSLGLTSDSVDVENPLFSLTIRPHVWWIDELKRLNGRAVAEVSTKVPTR